MWRGDYKASFVKEVLNKIKNWRNWVHLTGIWPQECLNSNLSLTKLNRTDLMNMFKDLVYITRFFCVWFVQNSIEDYQINSVKSFQPFLKNCQNPDILKEKKLTGFGHSSDFISHHHLMKIWLRSTHIVKNTKLLLYHNLVALNKELFAICRM